MTGEEYKRLSLKEFDRAVEKFQGGHTAALRRKRLETGIL